MNLRNVSILLVPDLKSAKDCNFVPTASVEAEYGDFVIEGELVTLAYLSKGAVPYNCENVPIIPDNSTIVVSHIDLNTVGGIMGLLGLKAAENLDFWNAVDHVHQYGRHILWMFPKYEHLFYAYYAWRDTQYEEFITTTDITKIVKKEIFIIDNILKGDRKYIDQGEKWHLGNNIDDFLIDEDETIRTFITNGEHSASSFYSKDKRSLVPLTCSYNIRKKAITIASCENFFDVRKIVQSLWGSAAGGHPNKAGSPRGERMTCTDFSGALLKVKQLSK